MTDDELDKFEELSTEAHDVDCVPEKKYTSCKYLTRFEGISVVFYVDTSSN